MRHDRQWKLRSPRGENDFNPASRGACRGSARCTRNWRRRDPRVGNRGGSRDRAGAHEICQRSRDRVSLTARNRNGSGACAGAGLCARYHTAMGRRKLPASLASFARPGTMVAVELQNHCVCKADAAADRSSRSPSSRDRAVAPARLLSGDLALRSSTIRCSNDSMGSGVPCRVVTHEQDVFAFAAERAAHALSVQAPRPVQSGEPLNGVIAACLDKFQ